MTYFKNLLVGIDQFGNAICGGNPDNTISARIGYFALPTSKTSGYYWQGVEAIVNFTFWPVDGPGHCLQAFEADPEEIFYDNNGDVFKGLLSVVIVIACVPISTLLYLYWLVKKIF